MDEFLNFLKSVGMVDTHPIYEFPIFSEHKPVYADQPTEVNQ